MEIRASRETCISRGVFQPEIRSSYQFQFTSYLGFNKIQSPFTLFLFDIFNMKINTCTSVAASLTVSLALADSCTPFPSSVVPFSSDFKQPEPPLVKSEFQTQFVQHKWYVTPNKSKRKSNPFFPGLTASRNQNLSHITTGYIVNSPSRGFVRVDQANDEGFGTSLFNYANVTEDGQVDNILRMYTANSTAPNIWQGFVNSNFPIFQEDILVQAGAVFSGLVKRTFWTGQVAVVRILYISRARLIPNDLYAQWNMMYQGVIPVAVFVNTCNVVVGYDYFAPVERTRVITEFFNLKTE